MAYREVLFCFRLFPSFTMLEQNCKITVEKPAGYKLLTTPHGGRQGTL